MKDIRVFPSIDVRSANKGVKDESSPLILHIKNLKTREEKEITQSHTVSLQSIHETSPQVFDSHSYANIRSLDVVLGQQWQRVDGPGR